MSALAPLRIGLALHVGELAYGNIGSANRLDFTAIGAAVNLTARLEGVCSFRGVPLVVSEELAQLAGIETEDLGTFELKGIAARSACWRRAEVRGAHDPRNRARQSRSCPNST